MVNGAGSVGIAIAFGAGMLSFLSPCVLPLVPGYLTFLTGLTLEDTAKHRHIVLVHALLFVAGFSLVFLAMGATATVLEAITSAIVVSERAGLDSAELRGDLWSGLEHLVGLQLTVHDTFWMAPQGPGVGALFDAAVYRNLVSGKQ